MALPRVLSIGANGALEMRFAPGVKSLRGEAFEVPAGSSPDRRESAMQAIEIKNVAGEVLWESSEQTFTLKLVDRTGPWFDVSLDSHGGGLLASSSGAKLFATKARIFCAMFRGGDLNPVLEPNV